jgi:iron complex transport system substrate-binding protein
MNRSQRMQLTTMLMCTVLLALSACAGTATDQPAAVRTAETGPFPVTVEHKFGSTTIERKPERVVSVGLTEQDVLLQLGVVPIAVTDWYGDQPNAVWAWARPLLGNAKPTVLKTTDGFEYEKIAKLRPDLIIGTNAGITQADYTKLSKIAPTVTSVKGSEQFFSAWDQQVLQIATAVGQEAKGTELVAQTKAAYAKVKQEHPEFVGKTATFSQGAPYDGNLYVYPDGLNTEFLTELGFVITPGLHKYQQRPDEQALISAELVEMIDADVIVFATESPANFTELQRWATIKNLKAVREGRAVYTDTILAGAIYFMTPLSLEYTLTHLTPMLAAAAQGKAPRSYPA